MIAATNDELLRVAGLIEGLKRECGMDPESPTAIHNGRLMSIAYIVRALASKAADDLPPAAPDPARFTYAAVRHRPLREIVGIQDPNGTPVLTLACGHSSQYVPHFTYKLGERVPCGQCGMAIASTLPEFAGFFDAQGESTPDGQASTVDAAMSEVSPQVSDCTRKAFEANAAPMGFDMTRQSIAVPEPWAEYADENTGHRWAGWLACLDWCGY